METGLNWLRIMSNQDFWNVGNEPIGYRKSREFL
jgi:hypothetical protein